MTLHGAPPWVRSLPEASAAQRAEWLQDQRRADETLLAVDEALHALVGALGDRLDDTYIFVLSDNGYSFGEHRWEGKKCPYEACVRIPLAVHSPSADGGELSAVVSIVDLAPTILSVAGVGSPGNFDGRRFAAWIDAAYQHARSSRGTRSSSSNGRATSGSPRGPPFERPTSS